MKICFIEMLPFPENMGGGTNYILGLAKALIKKGYKVDVITTRTNEMKDEYCFDYEGIRVWKVGRVHIPRKDWKGNFVGFLFQRTLFESSFIYEASRLLKKTKYDVINAQNPIQDSLPCSLFGHKFSMTAHGIYSEGYSKVKKGGWIMRIIEKYNSRRATKIFCLGKKTEEYYQQFNKECSILSGGVDTKKFSYWESRKNNKSIAFVGRLSEEKRIDEIIKAMKYLPNYMLKIIGDGPENIKLRRQADGMKNISFLGKLDQGRLTRELMKARFIVINSSTEAMPLALLEGMSSGCIPITTNVGEISSIVSEKTGFFTNGTAKDIAKKIKKIRQLKTHSKNCRDLMKKEYDWDKIAEGFLKSDEIGKLIQGFVNILIGSSLLS